MAPINSGPSSFTEPTQLVSSFEFERVLSAIPSTNTICILGSALPNGSTERLPAIIRVVKSSFTEEDALRMLSEDFEKLELVTSNSEYVNLAAWSGVSSKERGADLQIFGICPCNEKHIKKYTQQESRMIRETPALYQSVVKPYIESIPAASIGWVYQILDGTAEAEAVILRDEDPTTGFVVTPDLKWDKTTMASLYLLVITQDRSIRSIRDLTVAHLDLLKKIRTDTEKCAMEKYGIGLGELRMFVHYQPSYYHFHVHVIHVSNAGYFGSTVGQAHLLDDIIDDLTTTSTNYYQNKTFTYSLGTAHPLYNGLTSATEVKSVME